MESPSLAKSGTTTNMTSSSASMHVSQGAIPTAHSASSVTNIGQAAMQAPGPVHCVSMPISSQPDHRYRYSLTRILYSAPGNRSGYIYSSAQSLAVISPNRASIYATLDTTQAPTPSTYSPYVNHPSLDPNLPPFMAPDGAAGGSKSNVGGEKTGKGNESKKYEQLRKT